MDDFWFIRNPMEAGTREVVTFSSLFPNTKDKFFSTSSNMHFFNILKLFLKINVLEFLNTFFFKIFTRFRDQP